MRAADRRTLAEDLDLLADHLKRVYAISVRAVHPPAFQAQLPHDISVSSAKIIIVVMDTPVPVGLSHRPPSHLDYYGIEYVVANHS